MYFHTKSDMAELSELGCTNFVAFSRHNLAHVVSSVVPVVTILKSHHWSSS